MKKLLIFAVIFVMMFLMTSTIYADYNTQIPTPAKNPNPEFYGNVYVFCEDPTLLWSVMNIEMPEGSWFELQVKAVALINKGEVMDIRITASYGHSMIKIYYEEHIYYFRLKPYLGGRNFLLFIFTGDTGG